MRRNGSGTSSRPAISRQATSTSAALQTCAPATSVATRNAISSLASAAGPTRCDSPDGLTTDLFGQAVVPVSRSQALARSSVQPTNGTCGHTSTSSSRSAALQFSLENKLRAGLATNGSRAFALTWRRRDMLSGPPICRLQAKAHHRSDSGSGWWPTMTARDSRTIRGSQPPRRAVKSGSVLAWTVGNQEGRLDGRLNPKWIAWFMGFPEQWDACAPTAMPSSRKLRLSSLKLLLSKPRNPIMFDDTLIGDLVTAGLAAELINRVHRLVVENERHAASRDRLSERREKDRARKEKQRKNKAKAEGRKPAKRVANVSRDVTGHHVTFEDFWNVYPKRGKASNPKRPAKELFERHVKAGVSPDVMVAAARRYRDIEREAGRDGTDKIAQAKTWLSPREERWNDYPELAAIAPVEAPKHGQQMNGSGVYIMADTPEWEA